MSKPSYGKKFYKPPPKKFSRPFTAIGITELKSVTCP